MNINITNMSYKEICDIAIQFKEVAIKRYNDAIKLIIIKA